MAAVDTVDDDAVDHRPELLFYLRDERRQRIAALRRSRLRFDVRNKLTARGAMQRWCDRDFDVELIHSMRFAFADELNLWRMQAVDLLPGLSWSLVTHPLRQILGTPKDIPQIKAFFDLV